MFWDTFVVIIKIIALIGTWRTTRKTVQPQYYMALVLAN
jgi:hypothetical protein